MLRIIAAVLIALWLVGLSAHMAGGLIRSVLVIAVIVFMYDLLIRCKSA